MNSDSLQVPEIEHNPRTFLFNWICKNEGLDAAIQWAVTSGRYDDEINERDSGQVEYTIPEFGNKVVAEDNHKEAGQPKSAD